MYHALYRKYRPIDFDSVVGQDSIIRTLVNSIINNNFSHAYMFFGPRGTGKTTVSKIFARNVNCLSPVNGIACKECDACKVSFSKDCVDIIEIDAASNNGVDEIRDLRSNVSLVPSELKFKVYIIDEVHMLSTGAFNALLKTLEEPPDHVIFILATTDPQKVPETIISRCQCFSFKRISDDIIKSRLEFVCKQENIKIDDDVLMKIAILSDGGLRDALGSLDKLLSYTNEKITMDDFNEVNCVISDEEIKSFISNVISGDIKKVLFSITDFNNRGKNLIQILIQIIDFSRNLIVDYYLNNLELEYSCDLLQDFVNILNEKMIDIKRSGNTKVFIEMLILKFINDYILLKNSTSTVDSGELKNNVKVQSTVEVNKVKNSDVSHGTVKAESVKNSSELNRTVDVNNDNSVILDDSNDDNDDEFSLDSYLSDSGDDNNSFDNTFVRDTIESDILNISNIEEIINVRINNTMATAEKSLLKEETDKFELLRDFSFDQEIGYLVNSILDSHLCAVGSEYMILSYDSDAAVEQNLVNLIKLNDVYNKITDSNKKIAIVSNTKWNEIKNDFISNLKNNIKYEIMDEPDFVFEEKEKNDIISNSAISLFGEDIVEVN